MEYICRWKIYFQNHLRKDSSKKGVVNIEFRFLMTAPIQTRLANSSFYFGFGYE